MPRNLKLTWQRGTKGRKGRWRKRYTGKSYYFDGGRGKSDREAYEAAVSAWEKLKVDIDAAAPKPNQKDYETAIEEWDDVLSWCRQHGDSEAADLAMDKLTALRKELARARPRRLELSDRFEGQFDQAIRNPRQVQAIRELAASFQSMPVKAPAMNESGKTISESASSTSVLVQPLADPFPSDPLATELAVWQDRLDVMRREEQAQDRQIATLVGRFVAEKQALVGAGQLSSSRLYALRLHLGDFLDWFGRSQAVEAISGQTLADYRLELLGKIKAGTWSRITARDRISTLKSFVRWLWRMELLPSLPRIMDGGANALSVGKNQASVTVFDVSEIRSLLSMASDRTKLYLLLMLNCGMTQRDVADLRHDEVFWEAGRITRKRSKTKRYGSVPEVSYLLWGETLRLLQQERTEVSANLVLLNEKCKPLWTECVTEDGKIKKNDNIRTAYERLKKRADIKKPLSSLKKTSATLIRGNGEFASLERLYLGHAPQTISDIHYTQPPQALLDDAIRWLGKQYGVEVANSLTR